MSIEQAPEPGDPDNPPRRGRDSSNLDLLIGALATIVGFSSAVVAGFSVAARLLSAYGPFSAFAVGLAAGTAAFATVTLAIASSLRRLVN